MNHPATSAAPAHAAAAPRLRRAARPAAALLAVGAAVAVATSSTPASAAVVSPSIRMSCYNTTLTVHRPAVLDKTGGIGWAFQVYVWTGSSWTTYGRSGSETVTDWTQSFYDVNVRVPSGRYWSVLSAVVHDGNTYYAWATPDFNVVNTTTCHT